MKAVFDTSPLILLDYLGYVSYLPRFFRVFIPPRVAAELTVHPGDYGAVVPSLPWVTQQAPNPATLQRVQDELAADPGEEAAIALALDLSSLVVVDELKARKYADHLGLTITGTLGIILLIQRSGLAERSLEEELDLLEARCMWMSSALKRRVLERIAPKNH
jgi:uncharacterized protein